MQQKEIQVRFGQFDARKEREVAVRTFALQKLQVILKLRGSLARNAPDVPIEAKTKLSATIETMLDVSDRPEIQTILRRMSFLQGKQTPEKTQRFLRKFFLAMYRESALRGDFQPTTGETENLFALWMQSGEGREPPGYQLIVSRANQRKSFPEGEKLSTRATRKFIHKLLVLRRLRNHVGGMKWVRIRDAVQKRFFKETKPPHPAIKEPHWTPTAMRELKERVDLSADMKEKLSVLRANPTSETFLALVQIIYESLGHSETIGTFLNKTARNEIRNSLADMRIHELFPKLNASEKENLMGAWKMQNFDGIPGITREKLHRFLTKMLPEQYGVSKKPKEIHIRHKPLKPSPRTIRKKDTAAPSLYIPFVPPAPLKLGLRRAEERLQKHRKLWQTEAYLEKQAEHEKARLKKLERK